MNFSARGCVRGTAPLLYIWDPLHIYKTITARKLKCHKRLGRVKYLFRVWHFLRQEACKGRSTPNVHLVCRTLLYQMYSMGCCAPYTSPGGKYSYPKSLLDPTKMCVKSQVSSSNSFRDMRGSRIYTMGRCAPVTRPLRKILTPQMSTWPCLSVCKISTFQL